MLISFSIMLLGTSLLLDLIGFWLVVYHNIILKSVCVCVVCN